MVMDVAPHGPSTHCSEVAEGLKGGTADKLLCSAD